MSAREADDGQARRRPDLRDERGYDDEEQPEKVGGAVGGATMGAVGGALTLALGPLAGVIGILASSAGGWWAGKAFIRTVKGFDDVEGRLREAHPEVGPGRSWDEVRHAYQVGYLAARNPDWDGTDFEAVEVTLRRAWSEAHRDAERPIRWSEIRDHVRQGWDAGRRGT